MKPSTDLVSPHPNLMGWNSLFSGMELIVNRRTPFHRDQGGSPSMYDLLLSAGNHEEAKLELPDIGTNLKYDPGTAVLICGRVLGHRAMEWKGGDRVCIAHFVKDLVHNRLGIARPPWTKYQDFWGMVVE